MRLKAYIAALHAALFAILLSILPADSGSMLLLGAGAPAAVTASFTVTNTDSIADTASSTSYSKTQNAGTYTVGRVIVVCVMARVNAAAGPSSVTIGGVTAQQAGSGANNASTAGASIWYVDASSAGGPVTTNGNVTVVVNHVVAPSRIVLATFAIIGASASAPVTATSVAGSPTENTIAIPTGGSIIGSTFSTVGNPSTLTATSFTFDVNNNLVGTQAGAAYHSTPGALSGTPTVTVTSSPQISTVATQFAAWGP